MYRFLKKDIAKLKSETSLCMCSWHARDCKIECFPTHIWSCTWRVILSRTKVQPSLLGRNYGMKILNDRNSNLVLVGAIW